MAGEFAAATSVRASDETGHLHSANLDDHVPADPLLRGIEQFLDLTGLRTYLAPFYGHTGRPSIDPELMIDVQSGFLDHVECRLCSSAEKQEFNSMKSLVAAVLVLSLAAPSTVLAQTKSDEAAIRNLPQAFCDAWNRHDGHALAQVMADDVDFVTVGAMWLHGRPDFEKYHVGLLSGRFNKSTVTSLQTAVRFLRPDVAIVHWSWKIAGDRNVDGTSRQPRYGMMTMVAEKSNGSWLVVASQNDNADPWDPAEGQMPNLAMPIPGPSQEPH